jgi:predicted ATP-dependent endonuclease of OLD family
MLKFITIKNFKAIQSATVKMSDLSVFIGNNGSGKSSVIEALQMFQNALNYGLSRAFQDHRRNYIYHTLKFVIYQWNFRRLKFSNISVEYFFVIFQWNLQSKFIQTLFPPYFLNHYLKQP